MRKLIFSFLVSITVFAGNAELLKASLFSLIVELLSNDDGYTEIYLDAPQYNSIKKYVKKFKFTNDCLSADIIFVDRIENLPPECQDDKKIFVTKYSEYRKHRSKVVGAFFWQKGRPNIIFNKERLEYFGIKLPAKYDKYIE